MTRFLHRKEINSAKVASALLLVFVIISLWLIMKYADKERQRDLLSWQSRLSVIAEIRTTSIETLLNKQSGQLEELADNPSLRLFLSQAKEDEVLNEAIIRAQQGHVRNLIRATADRMGFDSPQTRSLNSKMQKGHGLAILDGEANLVMSTRGFPEEIEQHKTHIRQVIETGKKVLIDLYKQDGQIVYGYVQPVFHIQNLNSGQPVGVVMMLIDANSGLYQLVQSRQGVTETDETLLVRRKENTIEYLSPLAKGYELLHQLPNKNKNIAGVYAIEDVGGFSEATDYMQKRVLVTGRKVKGTSWVLVEKIDVDEALEESNKHQQFLLTTFSIIVLLIATAFIAIWRHSTSLRLQKLSMKLETHGALLDAVTNNIRENIFLLDEQDQVIFYNPAFAETMGIDDEDVVGRKLDTIMSQQAIRELVLEKKEAVDLSVRTLEINGEYKSYHVTSINPESGDYQQARLYVLHDISELKAEQEKREKLSKGIITTLVKAVDLHDPYCANHSERTREVAVEIAREMDMSPEQIESLEMAALLANIGKLYVPRDILTKLEPLSEEESKVLHRHIDDALKILADLSFNGPVLDIIAQKNERLDGSGYPAGLKGSEIMRESRILAVANAFVAMASSRAYRKGRAMSEVLNLLLEQSDKKYDRHAVAALFHIAENKSGWKSWQEAQGNQTI